MVIKHGARVGGQVFNAVSYEAPEVVELRIRAARLAGYTGVFGVVLYDVDLVLLSVVCC